MAMGGLSRALPFEPIQGEPVIPQRISRRVFENYMVASGGDDHAPTRCKPFLRHSYGTPTALSGSRGSKDLLHAARAAQICCYANPSTDASEKTSIPDEF